MAQYNAYFENTDHIAYIHCDGIIAAALEAKLHKIDNGISGEITQITNMHTGQSYVNINVSVTFNTKQ